MDRPATAFDHEPSSAPAPRLALLFASLSAAVLLSGCLAGDPDPSDLPQGPMYRCIGEAHYAEGAWEQLMQDLKANPPECVAPEIESPVIASLIPLPGQVFSIGDSVLVHSYVMDGQCNFVSEYRRTVPMLNGAVNPISIWNGRNAEGAPLPTGEYFVNMELEWKHGRKDTTYHKIGFIRTACPQGAEP